LHQLKKKYQMYLSYFVKCSNMDLYQEYELQIKQKVHVYSNFYQDIEIKEAVQKYI